MNVLLNNNRWAERFAFLNLRRLPARITAEEAGWLLGCTCEEIAILTSKGMLKPLGRPVQNARKWHSTVKVLALAGNEGWMDKATTAISAHWRSRNSKAL